MTWLVHCKVSSSCGSCEWFEILPSRFGGIASRLMSIQAFSVGLLDTLDAMLSILI